jgi:hypothetical protein
MDAKAQKPSIMMSDSLREKLPELDDETAAIAENVITTVVTLFSGNNSVTIVGSIKGIGVAENTTEGYKRFTIEMRTMLDNFSGVQHVLLSGPCLARSVQFHFGNEVIELKDEFNVLSAAVSDPELVESMCIVTLELARA